jgi:mycothiol system anti-sigma-R factor
MDCEQTIRQVYLFLDGELTTFRRWQITRHLNRCPPCHHGYDFELELRQVIATHCHDSVPDELKQRIADAIGLFEGTPPIERPRGPGLVDDAPEDA